MADLPNVSPEAERHIQIATKKAKIKLRGSLRKSYSRYPWNDQVYLDNDKLTPLCLAYATAVFDATVIEYVSLRPAHEEFTEWLFRLANEVLEQLDQHCRFQGCEDQSTYRGICKPDIKRFLRDKVEERQLKALEAEEASLNHGSGIADEPESGGDPESLADPSKIQIAGCGTSEHSPSNGPLTGEDDPASREDRLQEFVRTHGHTIKAVRKAAQVHKSDMQKWRHGELPDSSIMSQRIEDVLSGR